MKKGFFKSATSFALSIAMVAGMTTSVFADDTDATLASVNIEGQMANLGVPITDIGGSAFDNDYTGNGADSSAELGSIVLTSDEVAAIDDASDIVVTPNETNDAPVIEVYYTDDASAVTDSSDLGDLDLFDPTSGGENHVLADEDTLFIVSTPNAGGDALVYRIDIGIDDDRDTPAGGGGGQTGPGAIDDQGGILTGDSTVEDIVYSVTMPTTLDFAFDPFQLNSEDENQINADDFVITNETEDVPVKVTLNFTATPASGVTLVEDNTTLERDDDTVEDKDIFFGVKGATSDVLTTPVYAADKVDTTTPANTIATLVPFVDDEASVAFALDKYDGNALTDTNVAAYTFYGELNTYAEWADSDITIGGTYTLSALREATYESYEGAPASGGNPAVPSSFAPGSTTQLLVSGGIVAVSYLTLEVGEPATDTVTQDDYQGDDADSYIVVLDGKPAGSITSIKNGTYTYAASTYSYDDETGQLDLSGLIISGSTGTKTLKIVIAGNTYNLALTIE